MSRAYRHPAHQGVAKGAGHSGTSRCKMLN
ncbi:hypothetical protein S40285_10887 [Stachybotrys chlorohalonatus IBT 40285]|uniref:Uncharacterized protein n=1 Tax=Stachybotrys chlorohalonatus (strain IBT 40285) TaxID=1283841 RepID=A0A084QWW4_STAC4|nr:hypothetical protein S40285_10887 [Stachybotrys chlorohalonata IBT 40285]